MGGTAGECDVVCEMVCGRAGKLMDGVGCFWIMIGSIR